MKTVKRLTAAIVCVVMVLAFVPSDALAYDSSFSVQTSKSNVDVGEVFTVTVKLDSDKSRVGGLDFRLTYDSAKLEVTESSVGSTGAVLDETLSRPSSGTVMYTASAADYRNGDSLAAGALISVGFRVKSGASGALGLSLTIDEYYNEDASRNYTYSVKQASVSVISPLVFIDSSSYDLPKMSIDRPIKSKNVSGGVSGGLKPYTFTATGLPAGLTISSGGVISGTPTAMRAPGTATIKVADSSVPQKQQTITINFGEVTEYFPFDDVPDGAWYEAAVRYVYSHGLMNGTSGITFSPQVNFSRAMESRILYNHAGLPAVSGSSGFSDVDSGQWYSDAITWASHENIVTGLPNGTFKPFDNVTREQLAVMLYRYARSLGRLPSNTDDLSSFADGASVSDWAREAMEWAVGNGIISGKPGNKLDPRGYASRAEAAKMTMVFCRDVLGE